MIRVLGCVLLLAASAAWAHRGEISPLELVGVNAMRVERDTSITLTTTPTSFTGFSAHVTVSWSGVPKPSGNDWVGLYLAGENVSATAPAKYQMADFSPDYIKTGAGQFSFRVLNMRENVVFHFFTGSFDSPVLVASSNVVQVVNASMPMQGRIALTNKPGQIRVTWTSLGSADKQEVLFGAASGQYTGSAVAANYTYTREQMCGAPATTIGFRNPGIFYTALIDGMAPGSQVFYTFGSAATGYSSEYYFRVPPVVGTPIKAIAFGDLGQHDLDQSLQQEDMAPSRNTTDGIQAEMNDKQLLLHIGDISYARGYESQWEQFHDQIEPISTRLPYMTAIGNHERDWPGTGTVGDVDSGGECGVAYENRFPMPTSALDKPWYSFDFGVLHVIIISTEQDVSHSSEQYKFVASDLAAMNRTATPWVIFAGHRPYYIDSTNNDPGSGDQTVAKVLRASFEDLLNKYKVDLVFGAHHHSYQRTCAVYKGECKTADADGYAAPVIVDLGMAGAGNSQNIQSPQPKIYVTVDDTHHGYTRIDANTTHFTLEYIRGDDRQVHDAFTLSK